MDPHLLIHFQLSDFPKLLCGPRHFGDFSKLRQSTANSVLSKKKKHHSKKRRAVRREDHILKKITVESSRSLICLLENLENTFTFRYSSFSFLFFSPSFFYFTCGQTKEHIYRLILKPDMVFIKKKLIYPTLCVNVWTVNSQTVSSHPCNCIVPFSRDIYCWSAWLVCAHWTQLGDAQLTCTCWTSTCRRTVIMNLLNSNCWTRSYRAPVEQ